MDQWRHRLCGMDRRAALRCDPFRGIEGLGRLHRTLRCRPQSRRSEPAGDFPWRADPQGDRPEQPDRLGDERRTAAKYPWRAVAPRHSGLAGISVVEVAQPHLGARQGT